jgi:hypothetical protein
MHLTDILLGQLRNGYLSDALLDQELLVAPGLGLVRAGHPLEADHPLLASLQQWPPVLGL